MNPVLRIIGVAGCFFMSYKFASAAVDSPIALWFVLMSLVTFIAGLVFFARTSDWNIDY